MTDINRKIAGIKAKQNGRAFEQRLEAAFEYYRLKGEALIEKTPEPPKVQSATTKVQEMAPIDGNNLVLESYRVRYTGSIVLACAEILKVLRHDTDYVINIEVYPATQTPTCLPF